MQLHTSINAAVEQIIGREDETGIFYGCFFFHINLRFSGLVSCYLRR